jgi:uncharacterized protein YciI
MALFLCRLIPPRPSFAVDMSDQERAMMGEHVAYWSGLLEERRVVAFGPVADPAGGWGVSIVDVDDEAAVQAMIAADPVKLRGDSGFRYDVFAMPGAFARG